MTNVTEQKKWDLLGYDNADRRTMRQGVDKAEIREIREDKVLRAYHLFPASANTRHETYLRHNLSYERWNARDFFFTYVLDHTVKRIPTSADILSHPLT